LQRIARPEGARPDLIIYLHNQPADNYRYDSIGNLIKDSSEHISAIKWNVYGKITEIDHDSTWKARPTKNIYYYYDAAGNRVGKKVTRGDTSTVAYTWYVRDASGNVMATYTASVDSAQAVSNADLHIGEKDLYGSSRLGILNANYSTDANTDGLSVYTSPWQGAFETYYSGNKQYELTNHLGNVLATISDKKIGVSLSTDSSLIDHYEADVQTAQDYYPFGMVMPGRMFTKLTIPGGSVEGTTQVNGYPLPVDLELSSRQIGGPSQYVASSVIDLTDGFTSEDNADVTAYIADTSYAGTGNGGSDGTSVAGAGKYRYGLNGKEQDNEMKGYADQVDYGMRIYDPRVGRFLSLDPLQKKYPWYTPYQFVGNKPIAFIDIDGSEEGLSIWQQWQLVEKKLIVSMGLAVSGHPKEAAELTKTIQIPPPGILAPAGQQVLTSIGSTVNGGLHTITAGGWPLDPSATLGFTPSLNPDASNVGQAGGAFMPGPFHGTPGANFEFSLSNVAVDAKGLDFSLHLPALIQSNSAQASNNANNSASSSNQGSGSWVQESTKEWSQRAIEYQEYVTGTKAGTAYEVNGTRFDGVKGNTLLEAKSSYDNFINKATGQFYSWFKGQKALLDQARRQLSSAGGSNIEWDFSSQKSLDATQRLFKENNIQGIDLKYNPLPK